MGHHTVSPSNRLKVTKEARWQNRRRYRAVLERGNLHPSEAQRMPSGASLARGCRMVLIGQKATRPRCLLALAGLRGGAQPLFRRVRQWALSGSLELGPWRQPPPVQ